MADIAFGSVGKIIHIALKIKEAVQNVKQNEKDCRDIERCVARVTALIKRLDEMTEAMKDEVMRDALEDLAQSLQSALELVTKCQRKHAVQLFIGSGDMAKKLRLVQDDISRKVSIGSFATNVVQLGITLMSIGQAAPPPQLHQQGVGVEKPSHGSHLIIGDARSEKDETKLTTGSGAPSNPLSGLISFNLSELEVATHNFSEENLIGFGGHGKVFKGALRNGLVVAVKEFYSCGVPNGSITFLRNEMKIGGKLQHKNVGKSLGYCVDVKLVPFSHEGQEVHAIGRRHILVTAYLPNGTLGDKILKEAEHIHWPFCFRIIQAIAQGLHHLHEQDVVHLDLKPENILFDSDMNPVISDFGVSRVLNNEDNITTDEISRVLDNVCGDDLDIVSKVPMGTAGYMAPEYIASVAVSTKCDVFSFGVLLLRTIFEACAKVEFHDHYRHYGEARLQDDVDKMKELFDPTLVEESELMEVARCLKVGQLCREFDPADRPTMAEVLDMLNGKKEVPARDYKRSIDSRSGEA